MKNKFCLILMVTLFSAVLVQADDHSDKRTIKQFYNCYMGISLYTGSGNSSDNSVPEHLFGPYNVQSQNNGWSPEYVVLPGQKWNHKDGFYVINKNGSYFVPYVADRNIPAYFEVKFPGIKEPARLEIAHDSDGWRVTGEQLDEKKFGTIVKITSSVDFMTVKPEKAQDGELYVRFAKDLARRIDSAYGDYKVREQNGGFDKEVWNPNRYMAELHKACDKVNSPLVKEALTRMDEKFLPLVKRADGVDVKKVAGDHDLDDNDHSDGTKAPNTK